MALVSRRIVTVKKLFAALMEGGDNEGKSVMISPVDTSEVENLTEQQLEDYAASGSIEIQDGMQVDEEATPDQGVVYLPVSANSAPVSRARTTRRAAATPAEE